MSTPVLEKNRVEVIDSGPDYGPTLGFKDAGEFFRAIINYEIPSASKDYRLVAICKAYNELEDFARKNKTQVKNLKAASGLNLGVSSEGGFLVPNQFAMDLMKSTYDKSQISGRAWQIPVRTDSVRLPTTVETSRADGSRQGGVRAFWRAEAAQYSSSKPGLGEVYLKLSELVGYTRFTDELCKFSNGALEGFIARIFADEFAFKMDDGCINGTGAGQMLGILNAPALITVAKETNQDADTIVLGNIVNMVSRLPAWSFPNAAWFINQDILPQLLTMNSGLGNAGVLTFDPTGIYLLGRPVVLCEQCSSLGDIGDIILADMSQYLIGMDPVGMQGIVSIHVRFDYGENCMRWTLYIDGQPWPVAPFTPYKGTATQSPFVTLAARA